MFQFLNSTVTQWKHLAMRIEEKSDLQKGATAAAGFELTQEPPPYKFAVFTGSGT